METERILLRRWQESDANSLFKYASDPDVGSRAGWPVHKSVGESLEVIRTYFANDATWAVVLKDTSEPIGCVGYNDYRSSFIKIGENDCEIGYWIGKPFWNKGICTDALRLLIEECTRLRYFDNIWADHFESNLASGAVLRKCGFVYTGIIESVNGEIVKAYRYVGNWPNLT